jgi:hypothetical protein
MQIRLAYTAMFGVLALGAVAPLAAQQASDVRPVAAPSLRNPPQPPAVVAPPAVLMGPRYAPLVESVRPELATDDGAQPGNTTFTISTVGLLLIIIIVILIVK